MSTACRPFRVAGLAMLAALLVAAPACGKIEGDPDKPTMPPKADPRD